MAISRKKRMTYFLIESAKIGKDERPSTKKLTKRPKSQDKLADNRIILSFVFNKLRGPQITDWYLVQFDRQYDSVY